MPHDSACDITLEHALALDRDDPLAALRGAFHIPRDGAGRDKSYFCGNSLGLMPVAAAERVAEELTLWREQAVEGHMTGRRPWMPYHENLRDALARMAGARPAEVVAMNSLTVNLHLMMASFYRPRGQRRKILIEAQAFPSDRFACASQIRWHGLDPDDCLIELTPESGQRTLDEDAIESAIQAIGEELALVMLPGVQYVTGQVFDLERITAAAHRVGARAGFDLAHMAGNVPLALHDSACDFAAWCSYKYLNGGPGAISGCFVHQRHHDRPDLPRLTGWWGHDADSRFRMGQDFVPAAGADAWQLSNPPILAMAPLLASLDLFDQAGMTALRRKSVIMTDYLEDLLDARVPQLIESITPRQRAAHQAVRGCQLSLRVRSGRQTGRALFDWLADQGMVCDWREPDIIRVAPVPLYNRYEDVWRLVDGISTFAAQAHD